MCYLIDLCDLIDLYDPCDSVERIFKKKYNFWTPVNKNFNSSMFIVYKTLLLLSIQEKVKVVKIREKSFSFWKDVGAEMISDTCKLL